MIPGIIELSSRVKYGMTSRGVPLHMFRPLDTSLRPYTVGCSMTSTKNVLAVVETHPNSQRANLYRILGNCGEYIPEHDALIYQYSPTNWRKFKDPIRVPISERPLIQGYTFNIDPPGCRDIDDVLTISEDCYYITIADVSAWTTVNPELWMRIHKYGQTMYKDGKIVRSMIPFENQCSLNPGQERLGVSLRFQIVNDAIVNPEFISTRIINNESFTYDSIQKSGYSEILQKITKIITGNETLNSYDWVEALMIFYNKEAAKILVKNKCGVLRIHEKPTDDYETYKSYGVNMHYLAMKSAVYVEATHENPNHWGIGALYCHATSPIRRFADIVNQYVLKNETPPKYSIELLNEIQKNMKRFERDSFFLHKLLDSPVRSIEGIAMNDHRIWVPDWNRIVTCKHPFEAGVHGMLHYSLDMNRSTWKKRMVFRFTCEGYIS